MKCPIIVAFLLFTFSTHSYSQTSKQQSKAQKEFLQLLNKMLTQKNAQHHWMYEDPYTVVQPFKIDSAGRLSVTLKYANDSSWFLHRMEMPVASIHVIAWDMYAILESETENVFVYESAAKDTQLKQVDKRNIFHVALINDADAALIDKLRKAWEKLAPFHGVDYAAD